MKYLKRMDLIQKISVPAYENFEYDTLDDYAAVATRDPEIQFLIFLDQDGSPWPSAFTHERGF